MKYQLNTKGKTTLKLKIEAEPVKKYSFMINAWIGRGKVRVDVHTALVLGKELRQGPVLAHGKWEGRRITERSIRMFLHKLAQQRGLFGFDAQLTIYEEEDFTGLMGKHMKTIPQRYSEEIFAAYEQYCK